MLRMLLMSKPDSCWFMSIWIIEALVGMRTPTRLLYTMYLKASLPSVLYIFAPYTLCISIHTGFLSASQYIHSVYMTVMASRMRSLGY